jgi:ATP-dependent DNA helicase RecG
MHKASISTTNSKKSSRPGQAARATLTADFLMSDYPYLQETQRTALKKLGIKTVRNLLYHFPVRYDDLSETRSIGSLAAGENAVVFGKISKLKTRKGFRTKIAMAEADIEDQSGRIHCVWFNQPYLAKMNTNGVLVRIEGKVSQRRKKAADGSISEMRGELYFSNPKIEQIESLPAGTSGPLFDSPATADTHALYPIYPESRGLTSNWMYHALQKIFKSGLLENDNPNAMVDPIPLEILHKYSLPSLRTALLWIHTPLKKEDAEVARKRFAFEEIFFIQLEKQLARKEYEKNPAWVIERRAKNQEKNNVEDFIKRFPFEATDAQRKAVDVILDDFARGHAMSRLLEGDVGSGKTAVAAATAYAIVTTRPKDLVKELQKKSVVQHNISSGAMPLSKALSTTPQGLGHLQVAYMCPTEILATQHFESFIQYFSYLGIQIGLVTGSGCRKFPSKTNPKGWTDISKTQLLKWVAGGEISILIGTHALIQKSVKFKNLAYVIIDEQHRFGLNQRKALVRKDEDNIMRAPHLLSMTATPIPRTLALTIYGDLDLTLLDQMPHGRKPIITEIVPLRHRSEIYERVRNELRNGRQAYIICPRIDEPDPTKEAAVNAKSVTEEAKRLKKSVFPEYEIGILHSKMKPDEKDRVMQDFKAGKITILCATSVVEVGVNVPNATVIVIEGGERFGLAQLHQLRGRVIRSNHQAYCFVFTSTANSAEKTITRLKALSTAKNGFELAEYDLEFRGAGGLSGGRQWGVSDIAMDALKNIKMVEAARAEARSLVDADPTFADFPTIAHRLADRMKESDTVHFE